MKTLIICVLLFGSWLQLNCIVVQPPMLRHITVTGNQHDLEVGITATGPISPRIESVTQPDRLIVDLPDVLPSAGLQKIFINRGKLKDIRVGLLSANPRITRVVLDLLAPIKYRLLPLSNALVVNLQAAPAAAPIAVTATLPADTRPTENIPAVVLPPPASFPEPSRVRWILPILTMTTVFAMLVIALISHIQNKRMRRGL